MRITPVSSFLTVVLPGFFRALAGALQLGDPRRVSGGFCLTFRLLVRCGLFRVSRLHDEARVLAHPHRLGLAGHVLRHTVVPAEVRDRDRIAVANDHEAAQRLRALVHRPGVVLAEALILLEPLRDPVGQLLCPR
jgi:hypothetical protein